MKRLIAVLAAAGLAIGLAGCPANTQNTVGALVTVLGNAASSIAALENNPALAAQLKTDTAAASQAVLNWKNGSPTQDVVAALNIVEADLNLIPGTSQYAPLVDLAIGTVESILEIVKPGSSSIDSVSARPGITHRVSLANPPKTAAQFKAAWNGLATGPRAAAAIQ